MVFEGILHRAPKFRVRAFVWGIVLSKFHLWLKAPARAKRLQRAKAQSSDGDVSPVQFRERATFRSLASRFAKRSSRPMKGDQKPLQAEACRQNDYATFKFIY